MGKRFYITTAIDYTNGKPHLGHAYEKVLADVIARVMRLKGEQVHFLTGTDEHGQKVQQSAAKLNMEPLAYTTQVCAEFEQMLPKLSITNSDFVRTTQERHKRVVRDILQRVWDKGLIYKKEERGFYSVKEEQFLREKDRNPDGTWGKEWGEVVELSETNYFFKQSLYQQWLIDHIKSHPDFIFPRYRASQVLEFLKEPLNDLCISRPKNRLAWGIELPFDPSYVTYVWFDALINYISVVGYGTPEFESYWPANYHVIGKDILVPPHAVYWPIMLKAIDIEPPTTILAHGWWQSNGEKMSKSVGNVVDPMEVVAAYGSDAFRYFVMREMTVGQDGDFTMQLFETRYNTELANDLGNLVSRLGNMLGRYCGGVVGAVAVNEAPEQELCQQWERSRKVFEDEIAQLGFPKAIGAVAEFLRKLNAYLELRQPWKLAKSTLPEDKLKIETSLALVAEGLRLSACVLAPIVPLTSAKILNSWGLPELARWEGALTWGNSLQGKAMTAPGILFPKHEVSKGA
jgi:methionyl-tRNA synthetase